jgi:GH18 family chitinase
VIHLLILMIYSNPVCDENTDAMSYKRRVGYYELFNLNERLCDQVYPEDLLVSPLTHINLAFVNFGADFKIIDDSGDMVARIAFLKARNTGLRVNIAVGGWSFNDPPTATYFSDSKFKGKEFLYEKR